MITVWSVLWGDKYAPEYVYKLKSQVERHLQMEHEFRCLTEQSLPGIETVEPVCDYPGWWQKVSLFKPGLAEGLNLYIDLDTVIIGSLDDIVTRYGNSSLAAPIAWAGNKQGFRSGVMLWNVSEATELIWGNFNPRHMQELRGDQDWIGSVCKHWFTAIKLPYIASYKHNCRKSGQPYPGARIVCFHGKPDPHECTEEWIKRAWQ